MALPRVASALLVDNRVQLSLAFISPMSFPIFDWVYGGVAWSLNAGPWLDQIIALCTFSSIWCMLPQRALWGWPSGKPLAQPFFHAASKKLQNQVLHRVVVGSSKGGSSSSQSYQQPSFSGPTLEPWLSCSFKPFPWDLQSQTLCELSLAHQGSLHTCPLPQVARLTAAAPACPKAVALLCCARPANCSFLKCNATSPSPVNSEPLPSFSFLGHSSSALGWPLGCPPIFYLLSYHNLIILCTKIPPV